MAERKRYLLRVDPRLYEVLERWSADELRSVNAQIEFLLTDAAKRAGRWPARGGGSGRGSGSGSGGGDAARPAQGATD